MLTLPLLQVKLRRLPSVSPGNGDGDVARQASREIDDLVADAIAPRFQVVGPQLKYFLWNPRKRVLPAWLLLVDGAALVGAQRVGEPIYLHLRHSVSHCPLNDGGGELDLFLLGFAGRTTEPLYQGAFLVFDRSGKTHVFVRLFGLLEGRFLLDLLCIGNQVIDA